MAGPKLYTRDEIQDILDYAPGFFVVVDHSKPSDKKTIVHCPSCSIVVDYYESKSCDPENKSLKDHYNCSPLDVAVNYPQAQPCSLCKPDFGMIY